MKIEDIVPNPNQPRKDFDAEMLQELADSIKAVGVREAITVRPLATKEGGGGKKYQIIDGERRYRACKLIGLEEIPAEINEDIKTEQEAALHSFIINDQRSGYTPQDKEAYIYNLYTTSKPKLSTRQLAAKLGMHHSSIDHYLEAYRFRQKLPAYLVGTLPLKHTVLKETAFIKDDKLRIRFIKIIAEGKLRTDAVRDAYRALEKIPADREEVFEAYSLGMLTLAQIQFLLDGAPHGKDILLKPQETLARLFTGQIPEDVKERLLHVMSGKREQHIIKETLKENEERLEQWLAAEPDKSKQEEIRYSHYLQTYDTPHNIHEHFNRYSIGSIKQEFEPPTKEEESTYETYENTQSRWRAIQWWLSTRLDHYDKITTGSSTELAIAVIDLVTEVEHWETLKRALEKEDVRKQEEEKEERYYSEIELKDAEIERLKKELEELKRSKKE